MYKDTKVICPHCGQEIAIPEKEHFAAGMAIGKDSELGTVVLPPADGKEKPRENKAETRLNALRAAGVDTSGLFSLKGAAGEGLLVRMNAAGEPEAVSDDDPIFKAIIASGSVPERRLFRRWVTAQMFRMLSSKGGFTDALHAKGYPYQWKQTLEELRVQGVLARKDPENFLMRNRFFNKRLVVRMAEDYMKKLEKTVNHLPEKHFRGKPYKKIGKENVLCAEIAEYLKSFSKLTKKIKDAKSPADLYHNTKAFVEAMPVSRQLKHSNAWTDAYKGAGAYFTLRNLIMFHGCSLRMFLDIEDAAERRQKSLRQLEDLAMKNAANGRGYVLLGILKDTLDLNGIDIEKKRREWAEAKRNR